MCGLARVQLKPAKQPDPKGTEEGKLTKGPEEIKWKWVQWKAKAKSSEDVVSNFASGVLALPLKCSVG